MGREVATGIEMGDEAVIAVVVMGVTVGGCGNGERDGGTGQATTDSTWGRIFATSTALHLN